MKTIKAVDNLDAVAQALGIDTTNYQKATQALNPAAIEQSAKEITAGIDTGRIQKAVQEWLPS